MAAPPGEGSPDGRSVLRSTLRRHRRLVVGGVVLASGHQAGEALVPVLIGVVVDRAITRSSLSELVLWLGVLAVDFAAFSTAFRYAARTAERAAEQGAHDLRVDLTARTLHSGGGAERGRLPGALAAVATGDALRVGRATGVLPFALAAVAGVVVSAVMLLRTSVPLGLLVLLGTPPLLALAHRVGRPLERRSEVEQDRIAHASGVAADLVSGLRVLKGIGAESAAIARYRRTSRASLEATLRAARAHAGHDGAVLTVTGVFIVLVALVGGLLALRGSISIGELVAAVGLAQFLQGPFQTLSFASGELARARGSAGRVAAVLAEPPLVTAGDAELPDPVCGAVRLRGVHHEALRALDLEVRAGETLGVVADARSAGALLECLGRTADPVAGTVELDGVALTRLDPHALRGAVVVAAHDAELFSDSVHDNVAAARAGKAGDAHGAVARALAAAAADEAAAALPEGTDTVLAERGASLSGGQRQRIALARALAAEAPVLVVHDPTTAVDAVTESRIAARVAATRAGRTTIVVTTSPALLAVTDRVVVLDDGRVRTEGRHAELAAGDEDYRASVLT